VNPDALREQSRRYYETKLQEHGVSPRGVDWNSRESQETRFRQLARLLEDEPTASVLDYGCGFGALAAYLRTRGHRGTYVGFDVSPEMVDAATRFLQTQPGCRFTSDRDTVTKADYVLASGLFNVKLKAPDESWREYVRTLLEDMRTLSVRGFGFNVLTIHCHPDKRRSDLYYADPVEYFEHCRRSYSREVALLHDYGLYEFTILVRT
jgi:SAM-dependent methyltransferase